MISKLRLFTIAAAVAVAAVVAPATALGSAPAAQAAGDVCDICSINFDIGACEGLGGYPYDSTIEGPPPALSAPKPQAPAPAAPAPQAPAPAAPAPQAPAPAAPAPAPAKQGTGNAGTTGTADTTSTEVVTNVVATVPAAPAALTHSLKNETLTLKWDAPTDGGSPITGYALVLNGGTAIDIPADATTYTITLGAGTYDAALSTTNAIGASQEVAIVSDIVIGKNPTAAPSAKADAAAVSADTGIPAPVVGGIVLGALVLLGGGALGWSVLRRRAAAS